MFVYTQFKIKEYIPILLSYSGITKKAKTCQNHFCLVFAPRECSTHLFCINMPHTIIVCNIYPNISKLLSVYDYPESEQA